MSLSYAVPAALTIAGSDSGGGAGIQADLKTFAALGVYGTSAITAVTAQNTLGVDSFVALAPEMVAAQMRSVIADIGPRAAKTGMLANADIVRAVADVLTEHGDLPLVIDPVTHAKSGDALLADDAVGVLRELLIPRCAVVTPNLPEAAALVGFPVECEAEMLEAGLALLDAGAIAVVVKGGHRPDTADDLYLDRDSVEWLRSERIATRCTHGTGCTFSAAIAAGLARGMTTFDAVRAAKGYLTAAMRAGYEVGAGHSPVNHFYAFDAVTQHEGIVS
ncbi:MAG TPA: bifunctional hydroxymethylpyrimidine kinase/phosphomethylpyrimidine kinase [Thermomicrobiales bacterium]|nr:bifunctional hydroxymethylpyrimidine kinase/phosphomethylpyrimidine kinase [Thermomicrobiales bacterium]